MKAAHRNSIAAAVIGVLGTASISRGTVIAYEGFTGGSGAVSAQSSNEGIGWSGGWTIASAPDGTITSSSWGTLPNPSEPTSGYTAQLNGYTGTISEDYRNLSAAAISAISSAQTNGTPIYFSFLIQRLDTNVRSSFVQLGNTGAGAGYMDIGNSQSASGWGVSAPGESFTASTYTTATENTTLEVVEIAFGGTNGSNSTVNFWVDPTSNVQPGTTSVTPFTGVNFSADTIGSVLMFSGGGTSSTGTKTNFGEYYFGTTFGDVVPEPSTLAILCLPAMALLARRRHQRH